MPFKEDVKDRVIDYITNHMADADWCKNFFNFITDENLAERLGEELFATRFMYKFFEGIGANGILKRMQIRNQIFAYASIYEAVIHHILFVDLASTPEVENIKKITIKKQISIPADKLNNLKKSLIHDGKEIIPTYDKEISIDETKIRFDVKANCACSLGIISTDLKEELIEFYNIRNSIHLHAEIRKDIDYEIRLSRDAYRRLQPFKNQITAWQDATLSR